MRDMNFFADEGEADDLQQRITDAIGERYDIDPTLTLQDSLGSVVGAMIMDIAGVCHEVIANEVAQVNAACQTPHDEIKEAERMVESLRWMANKMYTR